MGVRTLALRGVLLLLDDLPRGWVILVLPELELFLDLADAGVTAVNRESASKHGKKIRMQR